MATRKLSQIAVAGSAPALTDQLVGVTGGTTDNLFSLSQVQATAGGLVVGSTTISGGTGNILFDNAGILGETAVPIAANGNKTFYVATTGSDSNPGTIGSPFATLTHALIVAAKFDYQLLYTPTINVANGTYTAAAGQPGASVPPLMNLAPNQVGCSIVGNSATPANVVIQCGAGGLYGLVQVAGANTNTVTLDGLTFTGAGSIGGNGQSVGGDLVCFAGTLQYNSIVLTTSLPLVADGPGAIIAENPTGGTLSLTLTAASVLFGLQALNGGQYISLFGTITIPAALNIVHAFLNVGTYANVTLKPNSLVNQATATGQPIDGFNFSSLFTNGAFIPGDVPGNVHPALDNTFLVGFGSNDAALAIAEVAGFPQVTGLIQGGNFAVIKLAIRPGNTKATGLYALDYDYNIPKCLTPEAVHVATQFDKTNDVALADIPDLVVDVSHGNGNNFYQFNATLFTTSNAAGGVKASVGGTCVPTFIIYEAETTDGAVLQAQTRATAQGTAVGGVTAVTAARIDIVGLVKVTTRGTLTIQFAQNNSNGTASSVLVGSYFAVQQTS